MIKYLEKEKKGITLIALVITIIVLLILAGISISMLAGENGLLTKAGDAKARNEESAAYEQLDLVRTDWQMERKVNPNATLSTFLSEQKNRGNIDEFSNDGNGIYTITKNGYQREIGTIVFYIYHSSNNKVETIEWENDTDFNICEHVGAGRVYGGYYKNYGGKGSYAGDGEEVLDGTEVKYNGTNVTWYEEDAYTENGTRMKPQNGVTYYLKEVPAPYLVVKFHNSYSGANQRIANEWILSSIDDLNYLDVGFIINGDDANPFPSQVNEELNVTVAGSTMTLTSNSLFYRNGYLVWREVTEYVEENTTVTYCPYWITLDNVLVKAKITKEANYGNCNLQGDGCATFTNVNN